MSCLSTPVSQERQISSSCYIGSTVRKLKNDRHTINVSNETYCKQKIFFSRWTLNQRYLTKIMLAFMVYCDVLSLFGFSKC